MKTILNGIYTLLRSTAVRVARASGCASADSRRRSTRAGRSVLLALGIAMAMPGVVAAQPVRVGCPEIFPLYYLPVVLADKLGLFKEEGLQVEIVSLTGSNAARALLTGSIQFSCNSLDHAIKAVAQGQSLKMIAAFQRLPGVTLSVAPQLKGEVRTVSDLKGKTIGVGVLGSSTHLVLQYLIAKAGMTERDFKVIAVPGPAFVAAIKAGRVDAGVQLEPYVTHLEKEGSLYTVQDFRTAAGSGPVLGATDLVNTGVLVSTALITKDPTLIQRFVGALLKANNWARSHSPEDIANTLAVAPETKADFVAAFRKMADAYYANLIPTAEGVHHIVEFHRVVGTIDRSTPVDEKALVDLHFVTAAQQR